MKLRTAFRFAGSRNSETARTFSVSGSIPSRLTMNPRSRTLDLAALRRLRKESDRGKSFEFNQLQVPFECFFADNNMVNVDEDLDPE